MSLQQLTTLERSIFNCLCTGHRWHERLPTLMALRAESITSQCCLAMRWAPRALCAAVVELTLCSIKCVEAIAACAKSPNGLPSPLCLSQCWSESPDFWSRDLAVTASDDRGSGEIAPGTPEEARISGGMGGLFNTQNTKSADQRSLTMPLFLKIRLFSRHSEDYFYMFTCGGWECWTFVNF